MSNTQHTQGALNYDPTDPTKMKLPANTTCGQCIHFYRCKGLISRDKLDTYCDWSPSRFHAHDLKATGGAA